jgi:subtilisin-like proprotein convertase family protein
MIKKRSARLMLLVSAGLASLGLIAGVSPASAKTKKKVVTRTGTVSQCTSTSSPILSPNVGRSPASAVVPVTVPGFRGGVQDGAITSVASVGVRVTHTYVGDLDVVLVSPGGKVIPLSLERGGGADGFGTGAASCSGSLALFEDTSTNPIADANPGAVDDPLTGPFKPEQPLSQLIGGPARGFWVLLVTDTASSDEGTLDAFSLNFNYSYKALKKVKKKKKK